MRPCRVHTVSDSIVSIVFPSDASTYRSVPSLCWLPPSLRFATFSGTMIGLRQPCNRPRRFVALSTPDSIPAIALCSRFRASLFGGVPPATESFVMPAKLIPGCLDEELHGSHRFLYDPLPLTPWS